MDLTQNEKNELDDALVTLQLCNRLNPAALKSCASALMNRMESKKVLSFLKNVFMAPQPLRVVISLMMEYRPGDKNIGALKLK